MMTAESMAQTSANCSTVGDPALSEQLTHNHPTRQSARFAGLCFNRAPLTPPHHSSTHFTPALLAAKRVAKSDAI
jgi:hypothetical protein